MPLGHWRCSVSPCSLLQPSPGPSCTFSTCNHRPGYTQSLRAVILFGPAVRKCASLIVAGRLGLCRGCNLIRSLRLYVPLEVAVAATLLTKCRSALHKPNKTVPSSRHCIRHYDYLATSLSYLTGAQRMCQIFRIEGTKLQKWQECSQKHIRRSRMKL